MSGIPPLPPLRIKEFDGSPNVIPVFTIIASNMSVVNLGGGKVVLDGAGGTGPAGPAGTLTIGSGITGGATDGFLLMVSDGATLGQIDSSNFQRAISFPILVTSGGTGRIVAGSATTLVGINSSGVVYDFYNILGSNNSSVTRSGTSYIVSSLTNNIAGKQDSISFPLSIASGGTALSAVGSAHTLLGVNSSESTFTYYAILASNNATVTKVGTSIFISATSASIAGKQDSLSIPLITGSGGTGRTTVGSAHTLLGVNSDGTTLTYYAILASDNTTVVKSGTGIFISATTNSGTATSTAGLVQSSLTISTLYPLSGGGNLSVNRIHAVDTAFLIHSGGAAGLLTLARTGASTYYTVQNLMDFSLSSGRATGGSITASATDNLINVAGGTGFIKALDSNNTVQTFFDWASSAAILVGAGSTRYIGVQYNAGAPNITLKSTDTWDLDTEFPLGVVVNEGGSRYIANLPWNTGDNMANVIERFDSIGFKRDERVGGLILSNTGTRNVAVSAGTLLARMEEISIAALDTSGADTFDAYYQDGAGGWTKQAGETQWNNTNYDDGDGTLGVLTALNYTSRWFYIMVDGSLAMVYGQAQYATLAGALNDGTPSTVPDRILKQGILIGRFIIQAAGTTPSVTQSAFGTAFTAAAVTNFSDLAGTATVPQGGTSAVTFTSGGILYGAGTSAIRALATMNSGSIIVGSGNNMDPYILRIGSQGQVLSVNTGVLGGLVWANTGTGAGGSGASTANTYIVTDFTTDLSNEFRLVQSGNSITISTAGNLITINATTGASGSATNGYIGTIPVNGVVYRRVYSSNIGSGYQDIYTVPNGLRAMVLNSNAYNRTSTSLIISPAIKISGGYYFFVVSANVNAFSTNNFQNLSLLLEGGESLSYFSNSNGCNVSFKVVEFDSSSNIKSSKLTTLNSGNNIVYTANANRNSMLLDANLAPNALTTLFFYNQTSAARVIIWSHVNSGDSVGPLTEVNSSTSINRNTKSSVVGIGTMSSGDYVVISVDSDATNTLAWVNVMEY